MVPVLHAAHPMNTKYLRVQVYRNKLTHCVSGHSETICSAQSVMNHSYIASSLWRSEWLLQMHTSMSLMVYSHYDNTQPTVGRDWTVSADVLGTCSDAVTGSSAGSQQRLRTCAPGGFEQASQ
jgi:hypothetical protein